LTLVAYFFNRKEPDHKGLSKYFWYTCLHRKDLLTNTTQLWQHVERLLNADFVPELTAAGAAASFVIDREQLRKTQYSSQGRMSTALLALYANRGPKDWGAGHVDVLASVYYELTDKPNLHHIFPQDFVANSDLAEKNRSDSLLNIAYLTALTNIRISNKNPVAYIEEYRGKTEVERQEFCKVLDSHLAPLEILELSGEESIQRDALVSFTEARAGLIIGDLKRKLEGIDFIEVDSALDSVEEKAETAAAAPAEQ
jgi:hypothetical protein